MGQPDARVRQEPTCVRAKRRVVRCSCAMEGSVDSIARRLPFARCKAVGCRVPTALVVCAQPSWPPFQPSPTSALASPTRGCVEGCELAAVW
jgi:hypothetical protein